MGTLHISTGKVSYTEQGQGAPFVLLHANPGSGHDFDAIVLALAQQYRVITIDWPGFGDSDAPDAPRAASAMLMADLLEEIVSALRLDSAIFLGNSLGGYAAARLALSHPEKVQALILVSSGGFTSHTLISELFCKVMGTESMMRRIATHFARSYLKVQNAYTTAILERTEANRRNATQVAMMSAIWRSFAHPDHDLRQRAKAIHVPTLVVSGRFDPVISSKTDALMTAETIPTARLVIMETGHMPFAEAPAEFLKVVQPFLAEVSYAPSYA
jgi:pimeloyl-ACP methyl ester carboxylesterase